MGKVSGKSRLCPCVPVEVREDEEQGGGGMATCACLLCFMLLQCDTTGDESKQTTVPGQKALGVFFSKTRSPFWLTCFAHFSATPHSRLRMAF